MAAKSTISAKITRPALARPVQRERIFALLDVASGKPVTWISAPGGSGKSTAVASYLDSRGLPCIWYQCDEGDSDLATFFYYMGLASKLAAPRHRKRLPLLTPEYLGGIPTFTRRYFETLFDRLLGVKNPNQPESSFVIVLDNYQDIPIHSPFHDMIATSFDSIPDGVRFLVLSRGAPPPPLVRFQANDGIALLDYGAVRFTLDESRKLIKSRMPMLEHGRIAQMHEMTRGWAAGIILTLERRVLGGSGTVPATDFDYEKVFDYFAAEIFVRLEKETRDFLLKSALLPIINVPLAEQLTGKTSAGRLLAGLHRRHLFTERLSGSDNNFQYHPLFREFLVNRLEAEYLPETLSLLRRDAAWLLEQSGQWEDAAHLYGESGEHDGLARMVIHHGRELIVQGRSRVLGEWIASLPGEKIESDPWLLYWNGICSFPVDLSHTRSHLERALPGFKGAEDGAGIYLSWAGIVDTYAFGDEWRRLDDCIADFDGLAREHPLYPSAEIELIASSRMLLALTLRRPDHPERVEEWLQRVTDLLQQNPSFDIQMETIFCMSVYYLWKGEYERNAVLLERAAALVRHRQPSPFAVIRIKLMKGIHCWVSADYQEALQTLTEGLEVSAKSGVHIYDSLLWSFKAAAEMAPGNLENAANSLQQQLHSLIGMENGLNLFFYHINSAWHAILKGNPSLAAEHMETVSAKVMEMGTPYYRALWHMGMAQVAYLLKRPKDARAHVRKAHRISLDMKSHVMEWYSLLIDAFFLLQEGEETEGLMSLRKGLSLGRRHGYVHLEFYQPAVMGFLCAKGLQAGIEREYVKGLIRKLALHPPEAVNLYSLLPLEKGRMGGVSYSEEWPYPVKVYTLGRFEIVRDDEPQHFSGKEQKKPLEMLKVLIAFGGSGVPKERLTDALWPDADGDLAHKSFETTLSRLRRLLGGEAFITYRARQLAINPLYCWVDCLALGQLLDRIPDTPAEQVVPLCEKVVALHKGPFLPSDTCLPWTLPSRETLKNGLLRIIIKAGRHHEQAGEWERASEHYRKGIETDSLAEEVYRRLMVCHLNLGNNADAVKTYNRCCSLLKAELGIEPSPETKAVYSSIMQTQ